MAAKLVQQAPLVSLVLVSALPLARTAPVRKLVPASMPVLASVLLPVSRLALRLRPAAPPSAAKRAPNAGQPSRLPFRSCGSHLQALAARG